MLTLGLPEPVLEFAFEVRVDIDPAVHVGRSMGEVLMFTPITGGEVEGPGLNGVVLPGRGDWSTSRGRTTELEARYLVRADDGAAIDIVNRGFWQADPEQERRMSAGEAIPETEFYYRTSPMFRTDAAAHRWLCKRVFVGMARGDDHQVCIRFFEVL